nr:immunoglobulin light chain junction region [Macaca mulatta]
AFYCGVWDYSLIPNIF